MKDCGCGIPVWTYPGEAPECVVCYLKRHHAEKQAILLALTSGV